MSSYSYVTLGQASQELANRLYDPTMQFWSLAELASLITEVLREFNALTAFQRGDFVFPTTTVTSPWYSIPALPASLRPYTVTDQLIYQQLEYSLLEPITSTYPLTWTGSAQFTLDDLMNAVQRRRDEILGITGCTYTQRFITATNNRTVALYDTHIDLRRVAYLPQSGFNQSPSVLWQTDRWGQDSYAVGYFQNPPGTPSAYIVSTDPPLSFDVDRTPAYGGNYDLLTIEAGGPFSINSSLTLNIPDDWTWLIRWGALADLLGRESNAQDPLRSKYAEGRYRQGLQLLAAAPALLALRIANVPIPVTSVRGADAYNPEWQGAAAARPQQALLAGLNLLAFSPAADTSYSATATVVRNAPVPVAQSDLLQIPRDAYDILLDECVHTAMFKSGGAEFLATAPLHDRFIQLCALYASKLDEMGEFTKILLGLAGRQEDSSPRYSGDLTVGVED